MKKLLILITALTASVAFAADGPITGFSALGNNLASGDWFTVVDVSDTSASVNGTNKKILTSDVGLYYISDTAYSSAFNAITDKGVSKNALYDYLHIGDTDDDGKVDVIDVGAAGFPTYDASGVYVASRSITAGTAMDMTNADGASGNPTITFDSTEIEATTWGAGGNASNIWTFNLSGTDPIITFSSGVVNVSTGTLQQGGVDVDTISGSQTLTNKTLTSPIINTKIQLPTAAGSSTLSTGGDAAVNTTNKQIGVNNGTKEVAVPLIQHKMWSFDPKAVCDGAVDRLFLMSLGTSEPFGIKITGWKVSFEADPTTEADLDLKRATAFIGVGSATVMDALDTTAGVSSESTAANINADAVVANGQCLYLEFGTAYTETTHQIIFELFYEVEED